MQAQPSLTPRIGYVYPAGGRQGAAFQVKLGGQYLDGVTNAYVSGTGVQTVVMEHVKPITLQQLNTLREKLLELQKQKKDAKVLKEIAEIRKKIATFVRRPANPAIAETVTLGVRMAADAEPGTRELRLETPGGLSNPLVFCVGQLPEFGAKPSKSENEAGGPRPFRRNPDQQGAYPPFEMRVPLPATVNGQTLPGGVDRYRFFAHKGQHLVAVVCARELIPYLPDAVPGWFQATLSLRDSKGKELAYDDDYRFHPDPVLHYTVSADGEYLLEIKDAIYRGREDFVYRIAVGELPFLTSVFPLGGAAGARTTVKLDGWNLPENSLTVDAREKKPGIYPLSVRRDELISNHVPFAFDALAECLELEPNSTEGNAQPARLPVIINGRISQPGDWDVFRFEGQAGQDVVAEVYARRLDSPLDSVLKLTDGAGRQLAFNDDHEDKGSGLNTHHADSWLSARLPTNGTYYIHLGDAQSQGGPDYAYRLRLSEPRPDFDLRVTPASINARAGTATPITVYALRKDGFSGDIALALRDAPRGFSLSGAWVPAGQDHVRLTLSASQTPLSEPINLSLEGRANIQGKEIVRQAVPAEDMMQAFAYRHLVPAQELKVAVTGRWRPGGWARVLNGGPIELPAGGTAQARLTAPPALVRGRIQLELADPPEGITLLSFAPTGNGLTLKLQSDAAKAKPGLKGNLIVNAFLEPPQAQGATQTRFNRRRNPIGTLPAIPFEVVAAR